MHQHDVWIDLECAIDGVRTVVCSLYAKREFPVRPLAGESLTFWSAEDSSISFNVVTAVGIRSHHYVATEIEDLAFHFYPNAPPSTLVRAGAVHLATVDDARQVVALLTEQHGFEVDPYGANRIG